MWISYVKPGDWMRSPVGISVRGKRRGPRTMPRALHHGKGGEDEGPATETES